MHEKRLNALEKFTIIQEIESGQIGVRSAIKMQAVMEYWDGGLSQNQIIAKYKIASATQLANWIKKYNSHSSLKAYNGGSRAMTKGRTTTLQERINIVLHCLNHNRNFNETANHFKVSYQQVYGWVKKYDTGGEEGLHDGRGRSGN